MSTKDQLPFSSTQVPDAFYGHQGFDPAHSLFHYNGWGTTTNFAFRRRPLDTIGSALKYGHSATFRFDRSAFMRGPAQLYIKRSALSQPEDEDEYNCFVDFEGFAMLDRVEVWHGQNLIQRVPGEVLYLDYLKHKNLEQQRATDRLVNGNKSIAERRALATGTAELWIDLRRLWFTGNPKQYFICSATASELEVRVFLNPLASIVQKSASANAVPEATILTGQLYTLDVHVEDDEKDYLLSRTVDPKGLNYKFIDYEVQLNQGIPHGQSQYSIQLQNLKGACTVLDMVLTINPNGNILGNGTQLDRVPLRGKTGGTHTRNNAWYGGADADYDTVADGVYPDVYQTAKKWDIKSADVTVWEGISDDYQRFYIWPLHFVGPVDNSPVYTAVFGFLPGDHGNCSGHKTWSAMTNPTVTLYWDTPPPFDLLASFYSNNHNNVQHHKNEVFKTFN